MVHGERAVSGKHETKCDTTLQSCIAFVVRETKKKSSTIERCSHNRITERALNEESEYIQVHVKKKEEDMSGENRRDKRFLPFVPRGRGRANIGFSSSNAATAEA